jgi:hypothetical protein
MTQLPKLLALCASTNDHEALLALRAIQKLIEKDGGRLTDLHYTKGHSGTVQFDQLMDKLNNGFDQSMVDKNKELEAEVARLNKRITKLKGENLRLRGFEVVSEQE